MPDVMTTLLKRSKTGLIASEGSRHLVEVLNSIQASFAGWSNVREVKNRIRDRGILGLKRLQY